MARRTFDVRDLTEVYEHWWAGRSQHQIAASLGLDRATVRKYLAPAKAAGIVPGGPPRMRREDWAPLIAQWWPAVADRGLNRVTWPAIAQFRDHILEQLSAGVTQATIHQRLVDEHGLDASYASLKRWVAANLPEEARRSQVRVWRPADQQPGPGEEAQVDYGRLGRWTNPGTGRPVTVWAFVMVLACSRHLFVRPVIRMDQAAWSGATVAAFEFFGGVPLRLIPDNLKTGVDKPDLYDPKVNRSFGELAAHYDVLIDPARAAKPRDKPRVERPMPYVRDSFWRGREFPTLASMQDAALTWCLEVAGRRKHRGLDGAAPLAVFQAFEAPALRPLPRTVFTVAAWSTGKVGPDIHVSVDRKLYSVPWRLMGQQVHARSTATSVQIIHDGVVVATHARATGPRRTNMDHYPPEKIAFHMRTPTWCRQTAAEVGPSCRHVIDELLIDNALFRLRAAQGVLGLREKYTPARLETACAAALAAGDPSYRTIKGILAAGLDADHAAQEAAQAAAARTAAVPAFLRGPDTFSTPDALSQAGGDAVTRARPGAGPATASVTARTASSGPVTASGPPTDTAPTTVPEAGR